MSGRNYSHYCDDTCRCPKRRNETPTFQSSPPPQFAPSSPTSSEPAIFSSDGAAEYQEIDNYISPRDKRKRIGLWWENELEGELDIDDTNSFILKPESRAVSVQGNHDPDEHREKRLKQEIEKLNPIESYFLVRLSGMIHNNMKVYDFSQCKLEDEDIRHVYLLNQVIHAGPDPGNEVPAESSFRSMVPEIILHLGYNNISTLHPALFTVEHLTSLSLHNNAIKTLPWQICKLRNLKSLNLSINKLESLPHEFQYLWPPFGKLEQLSTNGNFLRGIVDTKLVHAYNPARRIGGTYTWTALRQEMLRLGGTDIRQNYEAEVSAHTHIEKHYQNGFRWFLSWSHSWYDDWLRGGELDQTRRCLVASTPITYLWRGFITSAPPRSAYVIRTGSQVYSDNAFDADMEAELRRNLEMEPHPWDERSTIDHSQERKPREMPPSSNVPSLTSLCLKAALNEESPSRIRELFSDFPIPRATQEELDIAEENIRTNQRPYHICRCGKKYLTPAAHWYEFWGDMSGQVLPYKTQVCSRSCADQMHTHSFLEREEVVPYEE